MPPIQAELEEHADVVAADGAERGGILAAVAAKGSTASATTSKTSGAYPASHSNASVSCLVVSWPIRSTRSSAVIRRAAGAAWVRLSPMVDSSTVDGRS
jgi:hypothetical protein